MNSPTHNANGRKRAHPTGVTNLLIVPGAACAMVHHMEARSGAAGSCNSVFRYPSPFGWFCGVPAGSPDFLIRDDSGCVAVISAGVAHCCFDTEKPAGDAGKAEGTGSCIQRNSHLPLRQRSGSPRVARPSASRPQSALARGRLPRLLSTGTWSPVRSSQVARTLPIASSIQANADHGLTPQDTLTARQSSDTHKPSTRDSAAVAFLLPMSAGRTAGQDQEGR